MASSKRGKPLMVIVELKEGYPTKVEAEDGVRLWGDGMRQAFVPNTGYVLDVDKFLFNLDDGSYVNDAKNYLLSRPETKMVQIDSQQYFPGDPIPKPADTGSSSSKKKKGSKKPKKAAEEL